jgi:hypothetical protein
MSSWLSEMLAVLEEVLKEEKTRVGAYIQVCRKVGDVYPMLFYFPVRTVLERDMRNGTEVVREEAMRQRAETLEEMVDFQMKEVGKEECERMGRSGTKSLLWLCRMCMFVEKLMRGMKEEEKKMEEVMGEAYSSVLEPYHSWSTRKVFSGVVTSLCPTRESLLECMKMGREDAKILIPILTEKMRVLNERTMEMLERKGANFQSQV